MEPRPPPLPVLVVDPGAVEQGGERQLLRTHTLQHQADSIQGGEEEEEQGEEEAAVVGLTDAVVYPAKSLETFQILNFEPAR